MSWLTKLFQGIDYHSGRFESFLVQTDKEREEVMAVLDVVRRIELNRITGKSALESAAFTGVEVDDLLFGCRDTRTGEVIGCLRGTPASDLIHSESSRDEYSLDTLPEDLLAKTGVATRFAIHPDYRGTVAGISLVERLYQEALDRKYELCLMACEPGLYNSYVRMGFRALGYVHASPKGGFRIPMVTVLWDEAHYKSVHSPLLRILQRYSERPTRGVDWYAEVAGKSGGIRIGIAHLCAEQDATALLTDGMSEAGKKQLLTNAMAVDCKPGQRIIAAEDGGRNMYVVLSGVVEVRVGDELVAIFGEGEVFGELAFILGMRRTADVYAGDETRVISLSQRAVDRLTEESDRTMIWRNLARLTANRLQIKEPE